MRLTRRDALKASGLAVGGLAIGDKLALAAPDKASIGLTQHNSYFNSLQPYFPGKETLGSDQMRITFLGTWFAERLSQACNSVFVELGNGDTFVFDCGPGVLAKYNAMGIPQSKLDKVFLTHLHADHMTEVGMLYAFGTSYGRLKPLYVWGTKASGILEPGTGNTFNDGIVPYCEHLREAFRWHTESQSFLPGQLMPGQWTPPAWAPQDKIDSYDLVPFELDWKKESGLAYPYYPDASLDTSYHGVTITHFPSVHNRAGSIAYKLQWNGLSMIFTGDTKPNEYVIKQANGVDVLIHEMTTQPEVWTEKLTGLRPGDEDYEGALAWNKAVQESSHTVDKAFGYILNQLTQKVDGIQRVPPRLAVATHFPASNDTIGPSLANLRQWYPKGDVVIASDLMVLIVSKTTVDVRRAVVSDYTWPPIVQAPAGDTASPKYPTPTYQLDPEQLDHTINSDVYDNPTVAGRRRSG